MLIIFVIKCGITFCGNNSNRSTIFELQKIVVETTNRVPVIFNVNYCFKTCVLCYFLLFIYFQKIIDEKTNVMQVKNINVRHYNIPKKRFFFRLYFHNTEVTSIDSELYNLFPNLKTIKGVHCQLSKRNYRSTELSIKALLN